MAAKQYAADIVLPMVHKELEIGEMLVMVHSTHVSLPWLAVGQASSHFVALILKCGEPRSSAPACSSGEADLLVRMLAASGRREDALQRCCDCR